MSLNWSKTQDIALNLLENHKNIDLSNLTHQDILPMIISLPEFTGKLTPPNSSYLDNIIWTAMRIKDPYFEKAG